MKKSIYNSTPLTEDEHAIRPRTMVVLAYFEKDRPKKRADCANSPRPCPWVSCRYHTYLDVSENGSLLLNFPDKDVDQISESCALDVAERGGVSQAEAADLIGLKRGRAGQIERQFLKTIRDE